ncbi:hypothetical protein DL93DRAFT_762799 [Clavulina sp. PMI_390]|nr:hypothetical protein DL93DRAFT_762799 [Clavulina sp. PMI_390]
MFSSKFFSYIALFLGVFSLVALSHPVVDSVASSGLVARGGTCNSAGCNEQCVLDVLTKLHSDISVHIGFLDGHTNPISHCNSIATLIKQATQSILVLDVNVSGELGSLIGEIVAIICTILKGIIGGCGKYGLIGSILFGLLGQLVVILDGCLAGLVKACCQCCPGLLALLAKELVGVTWHTLGFSLSFLACGLHY